MVLSVVLTGGKVGVAYYEVETAYLYIMPDVAEAQDLALLQRGQSSPRLEGRVWYADSFSVLLQASPSTILVSSIVDDNMQQVLKQYGKYVH